MSLAKIIKRGAFWAASLHGVASQVLAHVGHWQADPDVQTAAYRSSGTMFCAALVLYGLTLILAVREDIAGGRG